MAKHKWQEWRDRKAREQQRHHEERQAWAEEQRRHGREATIKAEQQRREATIKAEHAEREATIKAEHAEREYRRKAQEAARNRGQLRLDRTAPAGASAEVAVAAHWKADERGGPDQYAKAVRIVKRVIRPGERVVGFSSHHHGTTLSKRTPVVLLSSGQALFILSGEYCRAPFRLDPSDIPGGNHRLHVEGLYGPDSVDQSVADLMALLGEQQAATRTRRDQASVGFVAPGLIRTSREAEETVADWLRWRGHVGVTVTATGADEGIDVVSTTVIAQVKFVGVPTGRPAVQQLYGVALAEGKTPCFFSLAGYTAQAQDWANRVRLATFTFDRIGVPEPTNTPASELAQHAAP